MKGQELPAEAYAGTQPTDPEVARIAAALRQRAQRIALVGFVWLAGGVAVSLGSYAVAEPGESYSIFWGAALFGAYKFIRGLFYMADPAKLLR